MVEHNKSKNHIHMEVSDQENDTWRFTGMYGESQGENKYKTWELLRDIHLQDPTNMPWLCAGDFNEILCHHEKEGAIQRAQGCLDRFREALEACDLHDLGFYGDVFTWKNKQTTGDSYIREHLDRAVVDVAWRSMFPMVQVKNAHPYHSDHWHVVTNMEYHCPRQRVKGEDNMFRFGAS